MHSSPHRNNSDFQLRYFMANNCHTADAAWCLMYEQRLDIKLKLESTKAAVLRRKARSLDLDAAINNPQASPSERLRAEADLMEWQANEGLLELAIAGAEQELSTIQAIMDELEPQRKYAHMPLLEAAQATQREEWLGEFKKRCENYMLSVGTIPEDHLNAMRNHPDFAVSIVPHVQQLTQNIEEAKDRIGLLTNNSTLLLEDKDGR
jgi:hypothetical protein